MREHRQQINDPSIRITPYSEHFDNCTMGHYQVFPFYKLKTESTSMRLHLILVNKLSSVGLPVHVSQSSIPGQQPFSIRYIKDLVPSEFPCWLIIISDKRLKIIYLHFVAWSWYKRLCEIYWRHVFTNIVSSLIFHWGQRLLYSSKCTIIW